MEVPDDESSVGPWAPLSGSLSLLTCCLLFRRVVLPEPVPIRGLFVVLEHPPASLRHGLWLHVVFSYCRVPTVALDRWRVLPDCCLSIACPLLGTLHPDESSAETDSKGHVSPSGFSM